MFMQFYVSMNVIKEMRSKWKFVLSTKYHSNCSTLNIVYIFARYTHSIDCSNPMFPKNVQA